MYNANRSNRKRIIGLVAAGACTVGLLGAAASTGALGSWQFSTLNEVEAAAVLGGFSQVKVTDSTGTTEDGAPVQASAIGVATTQIQDAFPDFAPNETGDAQHIKTTFSSSTGAMQTLALEFNFTLLDTAGLPVNIPSTISNAFSHVTLNYSAMTDNGTTQLTQGTGLLSALNGATVSITNLDNSIRTFLPGQAATISFDGGTLLTLPAEFAGYSLQGVVTIQAATV
jgi:hypothetical protein